MTDIKGEETPLRRRVRNSYEEALNRAIERRCEAANLEAEAFEIMTDAMVDKVRVSREFANAKNGYKEAADELQSAIASERACRIQIRETNEHAARLAGIRADRERAEKEIP